MENKFLIDSLENLAVLLIDMQKKYIDSEEKKALIPNQISIIQFCNENKVPIAVIEYNGDGPTIAALKDEINKLPANLVSTFLKNDDNAFYSSDFRNWLIDIGAKTLLIMGVNACACVYETANSAVIYGYKIITSDDLIAGYCRPECERRHAWYLKNGTHSASIKSILMN